MFFVCCVPVCGNMSPSLWENQSDFSSPLKKKKKDREKTKRTNRPVRGGSIHIGRAISISLRNDALMTGLLVAPTDPAKSAAH